MKQRRRDFLKQVGLLSLGSYGATQAAPLWAARTGRSRPNVLFVIDEDIQNTMLGCYNGGETITPNIDAFAQRGVRFDNAYCSMPECGPSRGAIFSGLRPQETGVYDNHASFAKDAPNVPLMPEVFKQNGYNTYSIGKLLHPPENDDPNIWERIPPLSSPTPEKKAEDGRNVTNGKINWMSWWAPECRDDALPDGAIARGAVKFLDDYREGKPFFAAVGFHKPHDPFDAPKQYFDLYNIDNIKLPSEAEPKDATPAYAVNSQIAKAMADKQAQREIIRARYACMSYIDAQFGKLMDSIKANGLLDNTIIVFLGDHGYHHGDHSNHWGKWTVYENCIKSPFILYHPEYNADTGAVCKGAVEFIDIFPTLCELCGVPAPKNISGKSLVPLIEDPKREWNYPAFSAWRKKAGRAVRLHKWKYMEWEKGKANKALYNLEEDPNEYYDLSGKTEYAGVIEKMHSLIEETYYV